jgi:glycosyltransferase involved in cell wall biosynthesis
LCDGVARGVGKVKIIAIHDIAIGCGGGFDQAFNAIIQMHRLSNTKHIEFLVFTTHKNNMDFFNRHGIKVEIVKISIFDKLLINLSLNSFWQAFQKRLKLISPLEKKLIRHGCDLVYFLTPTNLPSALQKLNYISTVWDLAHRETPEFPEVRNFNEFFIREKNFQHNLLSALFILADSEHLADIASKCYGIERNRFIAMPFSPTPFIEKSYSLKPEDILHKYNLQKDYFYYPAQFWAHKNHIRILQALLKLRDLHYWKPIVVFSGKDYGNLAHIQTFVIKNNLEDQVKILGFVPSEDIRGLYENGIAVVMPSYFGPTNLPPLEAWSMGIPLIYSDQLAEQAGNAALLIDPDNATELAESMLLCTNSEVRESLIRNGYQRLSDISSLRTSAEDKLCRALAKFSARRECWE